MPDRNVTPLLALTLIARIAGATGGMEGGEIRTMVLADRAEYQVRDGENAWLWDGQGWIGGDINKAWFKVEGEYVENEGTESSELQALYSRAIASFWDVQLGIRHDVRPSPSTTYAVIGLQGLAPYFFEVDAAGFISEDGDASVRLEAEYDLFITRKLILQPRLEFDAAFSDVPELGIGSGFNGLEAGLRLRYALQREFAPYVGVEYAKLYGDTADFARLEGNRSENWQFVLGVRAWF